MLLTEPVLGCCGIKIETGSGAAYAFITRYEKKNCMLIWKFYWKYGEEDLLGIDIDDFCSFDS